MWEYRVSRFVQWIIMILVDYLFVCERPQQKRFIWMKITVHIDKFMWYFYHAGSTSRKLNLFASVRMNVGIYVMDTCLFFFRYLYLGESHSISISVFFLFKNMMGQNSINRFILNQPGRNLFSDQSICNGDMGALSIWWNSNEMCNRCGDLAW